jgi:uncharacterized protein YhdP
MKTGKQKRLMVAFVILILVFISAVFILPELLDLNRHKGWIASKIEDATQGKVHIGHIAWGISDGIWLKTDAFSITEASTFPVDLNLTNISTKFAILPLLSKKIEIKELKLDGPEVVLKLKSETNEIAISDDKISEKIRKEFIGTLLPVGISVGKLSIQNGRIRIENGLALPGQMVVHNLTAVKIDATDIIPGKKINFLLECETGAGLGSLKVQGAFKGLVKTFIIEDPTIELNVLISSLDTEIFKPYLKKSPLENKFGGLVSLEINYEGDLLHHFNVEGSVNLTKITYNEPSLWEDVLPGGETQIGYQANVDLHDIRVGDLKIRIGNNTVNGRGLIKSWHKQPVIQELFLSSNLSLKELVPLIPWKYLDKYADKIRPVLEEGGQVVIEKLRLGEVDLTDPFPDLAKLLSGLGLTAKLSDISIPPMSDIPKIELVSGSLRLADGMAKLEGLQGRMGPVTFPSIQLQASGFNDNLQVTGNLKGLLNIVETEDKAVKKLLKEKGFKSLSGVTDIDMNFKYLQKQPEDWIANGSLIFKGINAQSHPKGVHLDNLQGSVFFSRAKTTQITLEGLSAKINKAPIKLAGKLTGGRTSDIVIDGKAVIKELDFAEFDSQLPYLDTLKLSGKFDLDLDFKIPFSHPADTRLDGRLTASQIGFHLPDYNTVVKDTDIEIELHGDNVQLANMVTNINDQLLHMEGRASNPAEPQINLLVKSPNLDVDQLLLGNIEMADPSQQKDRLTQTDSNEEENAPRQKFPSWANNLSTELRVEIDKGKYHHQPFKDLNLSAHYEKGILQDYGVNLSLANGKIITTGSADLREPEMITFTIDPDISNVEIAELSSLFDVEKMPLEGPLSISGHLEGKVGDVQDLLSSLEGTLRYEVGAGRLPEVKHLGKLLTTILSFINIKDLFSEGGSNKMESGGLPFKAIKSESTFSSGNMTLNNLIFLSDSLNSNSQGVIDFMNEKISLQVLLEPTQTINKVLGVIPVLGDYAQKFTNAYLKVEGPLDNPEVKIMHRRGFTDTIEGIVGIPDAIFKDSKALSKEIDAYKRE